MARHTSPTLTEAELRVMDLIWKLGEATVSEVLEEMPVKQRPAYNTVLTTLRILERKGHVSHTKDGRAHVYRPLSSRNQTRSQAARHVISSFFEGSPSLLLRNVLEDNRLSSNDIEQLKEMIQKFETEQTE